MPMQCFSCLISHPSWAPFSLKAQISGSCWVTTEFAAGCDQEVPSSTCSEPPGLALDTFTSQRRSSPSSQQFHEAASEKSKQPRLSRSHRAAAPQTELWETGFFISQLAYNVFDLQISLQNDTDRISYFFLWHLARLRRLLSQQVRELLIHGCGTVRDNRNFSSWHPGQGTK